MVTDKAVTMDRRVYVLRPSDWLEIRGVRVTPQNDGTVLVQFTPVIGDTLKTDASQLAWYE